MIAEMTQKSLFEKKSSSDSKLILNLATAFGITKTGLRKGNCDVLRYIFRGERNLDLKLFLEMLVIENPIEILSTCFATGRLKKGDAHFYNPNIPCDFLKLKKFFNNHSYNDKGFRSLISKFKEYFDSHPWEQTKRLELLEQDIGTRFSDSFFNNPYRISDEENSFIYDFHAPRSKEGYINIIYDDFESLSEKAKELKL